MSQSEVTASAVITFAQEFEESSSSFYERLAEISPDNRDLFLSFVKDGMRNKTLIVRTYQETITDALEACFCFKGLDLKTYQAKIALAENVGYPEALRQAIKLEEDAVKLYMEIANASQKLLATIPRAFGKVAENRNARKLKLESIFQNLK